MLLCVIKIPCPSLDALLCFINTNMPHSFFHLYKITKLVYNIRKKKIKHINYYGWRLCSFVLPSHQKNYYGWRVYFSKK